MLNKIIKVYLISLCLILLTTQVAAKTLVLEDITFETYPKMAKIVFNFDQPTKMVFYTIEDPPQIIADIVGNALAISSSIPTDIPIGYKQIEGIRAFEDPSLGSEDLYGVDFFIIDLKEKVPYTVSQDNGTYSIYVASSKDITLSEIEPKTLKPEVIPPQLKEVEEEIKIAVQGELKEEKKGIEIQSETATEVVAEISTQSNIQLARQWRRAGYNHQNVEEFDKAVEGYKKAIGLDPNYACAHNDLGIVYCYLGRFDEAIREFEEVIKIDSNYLGAYSNLALIYEQMGDTEKAIEHWQIRAKLGKKEGYWTQKAKEKIEQLR